jgi:hypothetical protein
MCAPSASFRRGRLNSTIASTKRHPTRDRRPGASARPRFSLRMTPAVRYGRRSVAASIEKQQRTLGCRAGRTTRRLVRAAAPGRADASVGGPEPCPRRPVLRLHVHVIRAGRCSTALQVENERECVVNCPLLLCGEPSGELREAPDINSAQLFDQHAGRLASDLDLWSESRWCCAPRRWRDDRGRQPEQLIGLDDHAVARPGLLASAADWEANAVHLATRQSGHSGATASMSAMTARRSALSSGSDARRLTSAASIERWSRLRPASVSAVRTASDSLRPSRISSDNARSDASSSRARTIREPTNPSVAQTVSQLCRRTKPRQLSFAAGTSIWAPFTSVLSEPDRQLLMNVRWLAGFREPSADLDGER